MMIYEELEQDHERIRRIMKRIESKAIAMTGAISRIEETDDVSHEFRAHIEELRMLLFAHARAEEEVFYRSVLDDELTRERAIRSLEEHRGAEALLDDLLLGDPSEDVWWSRFRILRRNVEEHISGEEGELFGEAKRVVSMDEAEEMGDIFREMKTEVLSMV